MAQQLFMVCGWGEDNPHTIAPPMPQTVCAKNSNV